MRAAIYARVSTDRQERNQTIDSQLSALREWATSNGHELADHDVFRDEGYAGSRLDRPALDDLRDAIRDAAIDILAVYCPDRLARKYAYQVLLLEEFRRAGCEVVFLHHPISDNPNDQLLLQIQGAIAEYERAVLADRFRRGKLQKAREGHVVQARPPYGYRYVPRRDGVPARLLIDDTEADLVRQIYAWLVEERLTLRQILKRLNFGPWFPRCGHRPWSPSTVHHIVSDPVYTGTAYANRYEYRAPQKPRNGGQRKAEKICRRLKPREQWVAIAVPDIVSQEIWDLAQDQLARNAQLSFRNNIRHEYLLRCLLTCGTCGLAMYGHSKTSGSGHHQRTYQCAGKDSILSAREAPCPRACVKADDIETVVWDHVVNLLSNPDQLLAQFQRFTSETDVSRDNMAERQLDARLDRLERTDRRLLDAYQAEALSLEELSERRQHIAEQRRSLEQQQDQQRQLRQQQARVQEVLSNLEAFSARIRTRLHDASFAEKQTILQLVIERIIVNPDNLEIRHVIPLRDPPPGSDRSPEPLGRLCSDGVGQTSLSLLERPVCGVAVADQPAQEGVTDQIADFVGGPRADVEDGGAQRQHQPA
jgi:site-specific DNA recombinase